MALSLGKMIHEAFRAWLLEPNQSLENHFLIHAAEEYDRVKVAYTRKVGAPPNADEMAPVQDGLILGQAMCKNYQTYHKSPLPLGFELVEPERDVSCEIPGSSWEHTHEHMTTEDYLVHLANDHPGIDNKDYSDTFEWHEHADTLDGRLDATIQDRHGRLYVLEHKTYGARPSLETLQQNQQFLDYTWILTQFYPDREVMGIAYDGLWKREDPPKGKTVSDLFFRTLIQRDRAELEELEVFLLAEAKEIRSPNLAIYTNRRWEGCWDCQFDNLCRTQSRGEDTGYIKRTLYLRQDSSHNPIAE